MKFKVSLVAPLEYIKDPSKFTYHKDDNKIITTMKELVKKDEYSKLQSLYSGDSSPYYITKDQVYPVSKNSYYYDSNDDNSKKVNFSDTIIEIELSDDELSNILNNTEYGNDERDQVSNMKKFNQVVNEKDVHPFQGNQFIILFRLYRVSYEDNCNEVSLSINYEYQTPIIKNKDSNEYPYPFTYMNIDSIENKAFLCVTKFEYFQLAEVYSNRIKYIE